MSAQQSAACLSVQGSESRGVCLLFPETRGTVADRRKLETYVPRRGVRKWGRHIGGGELMLN